MKVEQIYTGCLAQGAYYISSEGEAAIIDPLREVTPYLQRAEKDGAKIKYVFETHFHADFVSGHLDLAQKTGATIVYGPTATPGFSAHIARDEEAFTIGKVRIVALHTPGHTLESTCYLLFDEEDKPTAIFTGDTLFIGDVGRPDLAQKVAADLTQEKLAGMLYESLRNKIMPLPDHIVVYPAHGAGSACGKNMSKETSDSLGHQKRTNYALRDMHKEDFIREVTEGLLPPPIYFPENVMMNIKGYESLDTVMNRGLRALNPEEFEAAANASGALILDTRKPADFAKGFIPNAINIGIDGSFAPWVGALIPDIRQEILLLTEPGREEEVITRLARVGYDRTIGFLKGGMDAWAGREIDQITSITPEAFIAEDSPRVLDVRKPGEYAAGHLPEAENVPLDFINEELHRLDREQTYHIHCAGGYRSMIFASILKARGFEKVIDVQGGYKAIVETGAYTV